MRELCIIPCGKKKIWDKQPDIGSVTAQEAYIGTFHKLCEQYADFFFDDWVILSAKHGFLRPYDVVEENYDVTFNTGNSEIISMEELRNQMVRKQFIQYEKVVVLTGKKYQPIVTSCFSGDVDIQFPLTRYKGLGFMQKHLKQAVEDNQPLHE